MAELFLWRLPVSKSHPGYSALMCVLSTPTEWVNSTVSYRTSVGSCLLATAVLFMPAVKKCCMQ